MTSAPLFNSPLLLAAVLLYQCVIVQLLGLCPLTGSPLSGRMQQPQILLRVAGALALSVFLATLSTGLMQQLLLHPLHLQYFDTFTAALCVALSAAIAQLLLTRHFTNDDSANPSIALLTQVSVLGAILLALPRQSTGVVDIFLLSIGAAIGFAAIYVLFAALHERVQTSDIPQAFRGAPIQFITAGLAALALMGFAGLL